MNGHTGDSLNALSHAVYRCPHHGLQGVQELPIVSVKVLQLAEQRKATKKIAKTWPVELYEIASSQGTTPSPGTCNVRRRVEDGSHREMDHASMVSKDNERGGGGEQRVLGEESPFFLSPIAFFITCNIHLLVTLCL